MKHDLGFTSDRTVSMALGPSSNNIPLTDCQGELQHLSRLSEKTSCHGSWSTCSPPELYTYVRPLGLNLRLAPARLFNGGPIVP